MEPTTRDRLLAAAIEVIEADGEQSVRVRDIAAAAGVTEAPLYHYFGDRDGLISEAQALRYGQGQIEVIEEFAAAAVRCRSAEEFLAVVRSSLEEVYQPARAPRRAARVNVLGSAVSRPELWERLADQQAAANAMLADVVSIAQARGFVRPDFDANMFAVWVLGMGTGRVLLELDPDAAGSTEWNSIAIDAALAVMGHPPEGLGTWRVDGG